MYVPTTVIVLVVPLNALLNYLFGRTGFCYTTVPEHSPFFFLDSSMGTSCDTGFIGAPLSTAISFNVIALLTIFYIAFLDPRKAWHPVTSNIFSNLGIVVRLGLAGVGSLVSEWWARELVSCESFREASPIGYILIPVLVSQLRPVCMPTAILEHCTGQAEHSLAVGFGSLGSAALASQSILIESSATTFQASYALSVASTVRCALLIMLPVETVLV